MFSYLLLESDSIYWLFVESGLSKVLHIILAGNQNQYFPFEEEGDEVRDKIKVETNQVPVGSQTFI